MATANYAWPYPVGSSSPTVPVHVKALADAADASLKIVDDRVDVLEVTPPRGIIARHRRTTNSTTTTQTVQTSAQGVCWVGGALLIGRLYRVSAKNVGCYTVAAGRARLQLTYTTNGTTPTAASTVLVTTDETETNPGNKVLNRDLAGLYVPGSNQTIKVLISIWNDNIAGTAGTFASATWPTDLVIEDLGVDPGSTGTNI